MIDRDDKEMRQLADDELKSRRAFILKRENYYEGIQKKHLKLDNGIDRNIVDNVCEIVIDSTADFVAHDFPEISIEDNEALAEFLRDQWQKNDDVDWLLEAVTDGGLAGHCFARVTETGEILNLDAKNILIWWNPDNRREVMWYEIQWGRDSAGLTTHRQDIVPPITEDGMLIVDGDGYPAHWEIYDYVRVGGKWELIEEPVVWDYPLPPIVQWEHLPGRVYGKTELPDHAISLQDAINKETSEIQAVFTYFNGPTTVMTGVRMDEEGEVEAVTIGGLLAIENPEAKVYNVEMQSDLVAMREERDGLKGAFFRRARVVRQPDNLEHLKGVTNLGLRTLYLPMGNKANTLRRKYGVGITEVCKRLMMLRGIAGWQDVQIQLEWGSNLPTDERETLQLIQLEMMLGILSKRQAADMRGRNYDDVRADLLREAMDQGMLEAGMMAGSVDAPA